MATISPSTAEIVRQSGAVPGAEYLLEVANVRKAFPGVLALDDVSFRLKRGHVHALMGENGAGKSTLMKIIAGIYTPDSGSFKLKGQEIKLTSPLDALRYGIAMIHQELNLMNFMTVAENIWIRREPLNGLGFVRHDEMRRRTKELFERLDIRHRSGNRGARSFRRQPPDGRDRQGGQLRFRHPHHGRADLGADRSRGRAPVQDHQDAQGPRHGHRLHHPQDERAVRDRRRGVGVPRRPLRRRARGRRRDARRHHPADGRARDHPDVSQGNRADRRRRAVGAQSHPRRPVSRHFLRSAQGRDSRLRRPRRLGPKQRRRNPVRRDPRDLGRDRNRRRGDRDQEPGHGDGRRHGVPDRGPQGERLLPSPRHHGQHADRAVCAAATRARASSRSARSRRSASSRRRASGCARPISRSRCSISRAAISRRC